MNNQKPIYLMAGGRGGHNNNSILKTIFQDINKNRPNIAYVGAASEDNWMFFKMVSGMIKQAGNCDITRVKICSNKADIVKAKDELSTADAIFISGGDVESGMQVLEKRHLTEFFRELYQQGKLFFGASAGSIMLAREWVRWRDPDDDSTAELFPCLGLAPLICDTHAEEDDWEELKVALKLAGDNTAGYGIASGTCLKVNTKGTLEALGSLIIQYRFSGDEIKRQPDLVPLY